MMATQIPSFVIDDTYAYCPNHPTTKFNYRLYPNCHHCKRKADMSKPHTELQKKKFFALAHELGYSADLVKERAKAHFKLKSFNDATSEQLNWLIEKLLEQQARRGGEHKHE
jgi:hypothetical protein